MESDGKRVVRVVLAGQEVTVEVPALPVDGRAVNRKGGLVYSELYHVYFRGPDPTVAAMMGPTGLAVLCGLLVDADWETMVVTPDRAAVARMLGLSASALREQLARLVQLGVIAKLPQAGGVGGRGRRRAYVIVRPTQKRRLNVPDSGGFNLSERRLNTPDSGGFEGSKRASKQAQTCQQTTLNVPDSGGYIRTTNSSTNTTTRSSSMEKIITEQMGALVNLFFERRKSRRACHSDADVGMAVARWLGDWDPMEIAQAIKDSDWAEHTKGVERTLVGRPTRAAKASRRQGQYQSQYGEPTEEDIARNKRGIGRIRQALARGEGLGSKAQAAPLKERAVTVPKLKPEHREAVARTKAAVRRMKADLLGEQSREAGEVPAPTLARMAGGKAVYDDGESMAETGGGVGVDGGGGGVGRLCGDGGGSGDGSDDLCGQPGGRYGGDGDG